MRATALLAFAALFACQDGEATVTPPAGASVTLPATEDDSVTLEQALRQRRSVRRYAARPLELAQVSRLLWAAQGVTGPADHYRTVPSAGALHPLELYLVAGEVSGLAPGVYHYRAPDGALDKVKDGDLRQALYDAALAQDCVRSAPASVVISADYQRTARKYGDRAQRYVHIDAGHASQNLYLQATALGLGTVAVGAFEDAELGEALGIPSAPLLILPIGWPDEG